MNRNNFAKINDEPLNEFQFLDFCWHKLPNILEERGFNSYSNNIADHVFYDEETRSIKVNPELIIALGGDPTYPPGWKKLRKKLLSIEY